MASLDNLPADQRAVLQLVLQRGRSYDQIATLLSIDRGAVRERALSAFDALGPQTGVPKDRRGVIADYLLGQLEPDTAAQAREGIAATPSERAWARVVASELAPLAGEQLPEIPAGPSSSAEAAPSPPAEPAEEAPGSDPPQVPAFQAPAESTPDRMPTPPEPVVPASAAQASDSAEREARRSRRRSRRERTPQQPAAPEPMVPAVDDRSERLSSRLGGAVLIALTVVIVAAVAIILLSSGGSSNPKPSPAAPPAATAASSSTSASGSTTTPPKVVAQINLTPAAAGSKAAGIAEVLKEGANNGIAIVGQNVTPNTTKPPNAYAVWLYNSATDAHLLGFVNPGVGANGRLSTAGALPTNAAHFKQLIVTLESKASPAAPGKIILQGTLTGHL